MPRKSERVLTMVELLTRIWQRVLQRQSIGIDDNFFSLGGDFDAADMLFAEVAKHCGRELPSATIYHAQTIGALASLLEQPALPRFSPFVRVKAGCERPPILVVHGMAGTVPFFELAEHIRTGHPIYGTQAKGLDGMEAPFDCVEDMAAFYLDSLTDVQPHGPYMLVGYSFGGLVALEMAQRLTAKGEEIALLVLVDAYPHIRFLSPSQRVRLITRRVVFGMNRRVTRAVRGLKRRLRVALTREADNHCPKASPLSFAQTTAAVREKAYVALERYRPRFYSGKIKFIKSGSDSHFPADPVAVWADLVTELECETVPGGHLDMVTTNFEGLAAVITRFTNGAPSQEYECDRSGIIR